MECLIRLDIDDGKYTFIQKKDGSSCVLRYGEPWLDTLSAGANCWLAMAYEIEELRERVEELEARK